jgi:hypothetical protein
MNNEKPILIIFYGNSILIERLASKLKQVKGLEVKRITDGEVMEVGGASFIVTDLCDVTTSASLSMLSALSGIMLIGVDSIANTLTVLTGRARPLSFTQDILDALKNAI